MKKSYLLPLVLIAAALVLMLPGTAFAAILCVDQQAGGANNGSSWTDAYTDLPTALTNAVGGDEIWVAAGTYKPTSGTDRTLAFVLKAGVALYGGFSGSETARDERDWEANVTTLSGEIGDAGVTTDNSYRVVVCENHFNSPGLTAVLDGFAVTGGRADQSWSQNDPQANGGGMYNYRSSPLVQNVTFVNNFAQFGGGGMLNDHCSPVLTNVTFSANSAGYQGGGMLNQSASPQLSDVTFSGNSATYYGGGMHNFLLCSPTLTRVTFSNNGTSSGGGSGGGMHAYNECSLTLTEVSFSGNTSANGAGLFLHGSVAALQRVTFSGNTADVDGGALFASDNAVLNITDAVFHGNHSVYQGGAVRLTAASATITNAVFSNNTAGDSTTYNSSGAAVFTNGIVSATFTNVSFAGNIADEYCAAVHHAYTPSTFVNCIFWGNSAAYEGSQIYDGYGLESTVSFSIVEGGWTGPGSNNLDQDPLFVDAATGDLHLQAGSPAIDSGTATGAPGADLDGTVRPLGDGYDMGAYERVPNTPPTDITLSNMSVPENEPTGALVGLLAAVDAADPGSHSFALVSGAGDGDNASFSISGNELRTAALFDYETKSSYNIRVEVADQGGLTYQKQLTITVTDRNETPIITSNGGGSAVTDSVEEGETKVTDIDATDEDGDVLTYGIAGGDDASFFTINSVSGHLSFIAAPDYRHPQDADTNNTYEVVVQVVDDGSPVLADTQSFEVRVRSAQYFLIRYRATEGGFISGRTGQSVRSGEDGSEVVAVPDAGYRFVQWSDGLITAARTDSNVTSNLTVTAEFELIPAPPLHVDRWSDITDAEWVSSYGVTADQVWTVAKGFPDGTFGPTLAVTRAQLAKMVVDGFGLGTHTPAEPSFPDVLATHALFSWIEGAAKAHVVLGYADGYFRPSQSIDRQHVSTILGRYLSTQELSAEGHIQGNLGEYASVEAWFAAEGSDQLAPFADTDDVSPDHLAFTAYLVYRGVVKGTAEEGGLYLLPLSGVTRAQAVVLVLRVAGEL